VKKLATLLILAAACGPGLVEFPVVTVPGGSQPDAGGPPQTPADCAASPGLVLCGTQCVALGPVHCGRNNGACDDCTTFGAGYTCSVGACVPRTTCAAGLVLCNSGCCTATQVAAGGNTSCALVGQGSTTAVYCWGANDSGQLGPAGTSATSALALEIASLEGATAIALGSAHGCAIVNGSVLCWGRNDAGQLGSGATASQSATPVVVPEASGATSIAAGDRHSCAITAAGAVCWGADNLGQLGGGSPIAAAKGATKIVAGANHTCAELPASVVCWGANDSGQIGNGSTQSSGGVAPFTVPLAGNTATVDVAAGSNHTCAIISGNGIDGTNGVRCWGANGSAQIDNGAPTQPSPVNVKLFSSPKLPDAVAAGRAHTCVKRGTDGACIGDNSLLQTSMSLTPNLGGPISAGGDHTCYIDATNEIHCFGRNLSSELGPFGP
jgi:hypothetical protein